VAKKRAGEPVFLESSPPALESLLPDWPGLMTLAMATASQRRHRVARCRWCQQQFVKVLESETFRGHWLCETETCALRQIRRAILDAKSDPARPFLYVPLPLQVDMQESTVKRLLVAGAAGACKSYGARWSLYALCREVPGAQCLLLRCTYPELQKNHLKFMAAEALALGDAKFVGGNMPEMRFENGSLISMGYCDNPGDVSRHMGPEWDKIALEEGNNMVPEAITDIPTRDRGSITAQRGLGHEQDGSTLILGNPGGRGMLTLIDHYITRQPDPLDFPDYNASQYGFIHATLEDNPYLKEDYAETTLSGLSAARYQQLRFGDWTVFTGSFFGELSDRHFATVA
jgi:hypothetical protein